MGSEQLFPSKELEWIIAINKYDSDNPLFHYHKGLGWQTLEVFADASIFQLKTRSLLPTKTHLLLQWYDNRHRYTPKRPTDGYDRLYNGFFCPYA